MQKIAVLCIILILLIAGCLTGDQQVKTNDSYQPIESPAPTPIGTINGKTSPESLYVSYIQLFDNGEYENALNLVLNYDLTGKMPESMVNDFVKSSQQMYGVNGEYLTVNNVNVVGKERFGESLSDFNNNQTQFNLFNKQCQDMYLVTITFTQIRTDPKPPHTQITESLTQKGITCLWNGSWYLIPWFYIPN